MLYTHYTEKLLGLQEAKITNIEEKEENLEISIELPQKKHSCPCCGEETDTECCGLKQFEKCAQTIRNWYSGIANSFDSSITNGFTEGCNNKIKVLKRNAFGYKNFSRFRNRILHIFSL